MNAKEEKQSSKWFSRKLVVWVVWTILTAFALITKIESVTISEILSFYGFISLAYIGANTIGKFVDYRSIKK
jgi:hypothetical protein